MVSVLWRSISKFKNELFNQFSFVSGSLLVVRLFKRINNSFDILAMNFDSVQEVQDLVVARVCENKHVLGKGFNQRHKISLGIEPGISSELFLERLKTLYDSTDTKVIVTLGAVKRTNYKIDNTEMESLLCWFFDSNSIFFLFYTFHKLFGICVLTSHNIRNAEVCKNDSSNAQKIIHLSSNEWFIVSDGVPIFVVLHEEDVGNVEFPGLVLTTEFGRLSEYFFYLGIVRFVPVDFCLHHEDWNILIQGLVILLKGSCDSLRISGDSSILNGFCLLSQDVDVVVSEDLKFSICFFL